MRYTYKLVSGLALKTEVIKGATFDFLEDVIRSGSRIFPKEELERLSLCMQCGTCVGGCPSGRMTAWRIRKIFEETRLGLREKVFLDETLWNFTTCYTCQERCPRGIHTTDLVRVIRNLAVRHGYMKSSHQRICRILLKYGHAVPVNDEIRAMRKELGLAEVPPTVHSHPEGLEEVCLLSWVHHA